MKKGKRLTIFVLFLQFVLISSSIGVISVGSDHEEMEKPSNSTIEVFQQFSAPEMKLNNEFVNIYLEEGNSFIRDADEPILPVFLKTLEFPLGTHVKDIKCIHPKIEEIPLPRKVTLEPNPLNNKINTRGIEKNEEAYNGNHLFPNDWYSYKLGGGLNKDNKHTTFLKLQLNPVRYNPIRNSLQFINSIKLEITYEQPRNTIVSPEKYDLLILSYDNYTSSLKPLMSYKNNHGIKTKLVSLKDIYNSTYFLIEGRDNPEKIKYFIKNAIEEWGIKYVMLVGGYDYLPVRYSYLNDRSATWEYERRFISDLYYADIYNSDGQFSSWDSNGNGYYGEYDHDTPDGRKTDRVDLYPDVYIGRLACRSEREVKTVVGKIIQYENNMFENEWFKNMVLCGGDLYPNDPCGNIAEGTYLLEAIAKQMTDFNIIREYPSNGMNMLSITKSINQGAGFVVLTGAGGRHMWATHPYDDEKWIYYYNLNIRLLSNQQKLPIVLTTGARLSKFESSQSNRECFNWVFVSKRGGGAVASIGPTGLCWIGHGKNVTSYYLGNLILRLFQEYHNTNILGAIVGDATREYLNAFDYGHHGVSESFHIKAAEELELFGDPSLEIKRYTPIKTMNNNPRTLYVGGSGSDNYTRIQDAVDNAGNGDTVFVYNGIYYEDVKINKSISLIGQDKTRTILKSQGEGITFIADNIQLKGFTIESNSSGKNEAGIHCYGQESRIKNSIISRYDWGLYFENASDSLIENNSLVSNNEYAIYIVNSSNVQIIGNNIENNMYGVWSEYSPAMIIQGNNLSLNSWYALWLDTSSKSDILDNIFIKNWYSIYLYSSDNNNISENNVLQNEHGPQFVNSDNNIFNCNNIEKNEHYGTFTGRYSTGNIFTENNFIGNAQNARDDHSSIWDKNYWSDYIGIKIKILWLFGYPYHVPGKTNQWDWHPRITPS